MWKPSFPATLTRYLVVAVSPSSAVVHLFQYVLVCANTGGLEGLRAQLLILVGDQVDAEGEFVDVGTLAAEIEDADLGVGHTTVEAGLGVRLRRVRGLAVGSRRRSQLS